MFKCLNLLTESYLPPKSADTSPPTLDQLSVELKDIDNWYLLGLQLNIRKDILDSIEKVHDTKMRRCIETVQHWMNNTNNPKWETVHEALRNIGESVIAARIAKKYHVQPSSVSVQGHSGCIEEVKSKAIITREQWRISTYFTTVLFWITKILEEEIKPEELVQFLCLQCHPLYPEALYVDRKILNSTGSVSDIMKSLVPDYINYMDTGLLEAILGTFQVHEAQKLLQQYHDRYPHLRQLRDMPDPISDERLDLTRRKRLKAKCDLDFDSAKAGDVKRVKTSIEGATGINQQFVTIAQTDEGSLILTFLIPESVSGIFQELCNEDLELLAEAGIMELQISGFVLSDIQKYCSQGTRNPVQSTGVFDAGQNATRVKGYDAYIEHRSEPFTSNEKAQLTGLLGSVSKSKLEEVCSDSYLQQLSTHIRDWKKLAPRFGISNLEAEELTHCYQTLSEQGYWALHCWKQINPKTAMYGELIACLLAHAPFDLTKAALKMLIPGK